MLDLAFAALCAAVLIGSGLAVLYLHWPGKAPPGMLRLIHGAVGALSLAALLAALRRGLPRTGMGTSGFGMTAAGLLGLVLLLGGAIAIARRRGRPPGALVGAHATFAIAALVLVLSLIVLSPGGPPGN